MCVQELTQAQKFAERVLSATPDFEISDYTNDDDETTEATASWRSSGYPVTATATVERIDGRWVLDGASRIDVLVDDFDEEDGEFKGLQDALEQKQTDLVDMFSWQYN